MRIYRRLSQPVPQDTVVAIGNFDGVHCGHQALIDETLRQASKRGISSAIVTFEPHPHQVFQPHIAPFRLTPFWTKAQALKAYGVQVLYAVPFTLSLSQMSAERFLQFVVHQCRAKHIVVGEDFVFGQGREGNAAFLQRRSLDNGFDLTLIRSHKDEHGNVFSATRIRHELRQGNPSKAARLLGRPWRLSGHVQKGDQRGRQIGVPTANITLKNYLRPAFGVYGVRVITSSGQIFPGLANIGSRPTVGGIQERLEVHLLDQHLDLYGQRLCVDLLTFFRPEVKFASFQDLADQIQKDISVAREFFATKEIQACLSTKLL